MIDPKLINDKDARAAMGRLFNTLPRAKRTLGTQTFTDMVCLEGTYNKAMNLLDGLRGYFLETTGEESPFVKKIDEVMERRTK